MATIIDNSSEKAEATLSSGVSIPPVLFKGEIEIFPNQRLVYLDKGEVKAYAARSRTGNAAFAMVCERHLVPHIFNASKYYALSSIGLPKLLGTGLVDWAPLRQHRYVFVYENKLGKPIANAYTKFAMGLKPDVVLSSIIKNIVPTIQDMHDSDFVHGNIRVENLFDGGGSGLDKTMLGECLSTPIGSMNSVLYEPIERAVAEPLARGMPSFEDELYSFGVMLAILMRTHNQYSDASDEELIQYKIEQGSYVTLTGKERFSGAILELLRGLLNDDVKQRWTLDDIITWTDGRRVNSKQNINPRPKANRPIDIDGHKFLKPDEVSIYLSTMPTSTARIVDNGDLKMWLSRSIRDKPFEEKIETSINIARSHGSSGLTYDDRLSAFLGMGLSPNFPIMYRKHRLMPHGLGRALVEAIVNRKDLNPFVEIIQTQMPSFWVSNASKAGLDTTEILQNFETCRAFLRQGVIGYGIERCVYFLAPEAPCLSEKLKDYHVRTPEELLLAYEDMIIKGDKPEGFFDRHVVAFLSVRDRSVIDPYLPDLNSNLPHRQLLSAFKIFAAIQKRSQLVTLPNVASVLLQDSNIIIDRFHDRDKREKLREQIRSMKDKGDLNKLLTILDNPSGIHEDLRQFRIMMKQFILLRNEHAKLEFDLENDPQFGFKAGRQTAIVVSGLLASFAILVYLMFNGGV
jgi:hypothetical protein